MNIAKSAVNTKSFSAASRKCWMPKCRTGINGREGTFLPPFCRGLLFPGVEIQGSRWSGSPAQEGSPYTLQSPAAKVLELGGGNLFLSSQRALVGFLILITLPVLRNNSSYDAR